jgi:endo-1,4-beta-D-glucanase Y
MKHLIPVCAMLLLCRATLASRPKIPAQEISVMNGSWPLWNAYAARFLDPRGRVVDHDAGDRTTSEAQSYALFFSLVANDRQSFERVLKWTGDNMTKGGLTNQLPGWLWGRDKDGQWKQLDVNSASDSDLWIAYILMQAARLWHEPSFQVLGEALRDRAVKQEIITVPGLGETLLPGEYGFHASPQEYRLNPSYLPLQVLLGLTKDMPDSPLRQSAAGLPVILRGSSPAGYAMDWVDYHTTRGFEGNQGIGSYDAIRVYLWAGIADEATPHRSDVLSCLHGMRAYLRDNPMAPVQVNQAGVVSGGKSGPGFAAAVIPFLDAVNENKARETQTQLLKSQFDEASGLYGKPARYYDQNLALFAMGWAEHRFRFDREGNLSVLWSSQ